MPTAAVVGGGPGGLMAAEVLATAGVAVTIYERMPSVGRKLLLAGRGGLNLTHSEPVDLMLSRYGPARSVIEPTIRAFGADDVAAWCRGLGQDTFVGSSGRVFPRSLRATPLLRAWLARLGSLDVDIRLRHRWTGWDDASGLTFVDASGSSVSAEPDVCVLALGGASWPRTGSDGAWTTPVARSGIAVAPWRPANSGFAVGWTAPFRDRFAGVPVKSVRISVDGTASGGEAMITDSGIEGGAVYAVSQTLRDLIDRDGYGVVHLDLQPDVELSRLADRLAQRRAGESMSTLLRRAGRLTPVAIGLLREATGNDLPGPAAELAALIKDAAITVSGPESIDRAISSAGGIRLGEIDDRFMVRSRPGTFVAGEMLDWEAPTGGYLLQACFSTAVAAARGALAWLADEALGAVTPA
jgi:hypothetical protein